jgi:hypothetical protein
MGVREAIREAEALLPGEPVEEGLGPRWQAIIAVGEHLQDEPAAVWDFIRKWGRHTQEDLRVAIGTCLLEHLLEHHFAAYFSQVEELALSDPLFASTFLGCWQYGQSEEPRHAERFQALKARLLE